MQNGIPLSIFIAALFLKWHWVSNLLMPFCVEGQPLLESSQALVHCALHPRGKEQLAWLYSGFCCLCSGISDHSACRAPALIGSLPRVAFMRKSSPHWGSFLTLPVAVQETLELHIPCQKSHWAAHLIHVLHPTFIKNKADILISI